MKLKHISGDFVTAYNRTLDDLKKEQKELDDKYAAEFNRIVRMEVTRLEQVAPVPFEPGVTVRDRDGRMGKVLSCPASLWIREDENYHGTLYGPGRYFSLNSEVDEEIVTCEGMVRQVSVEFEPTNLEEDWGTDKRVKLLWPDELTEII